MQIVRTIYDLICLVFVAIGIFLGFKTSVILGLILLVCPFNVPAAIGLIEVFGHIDVCARIVAFVTNHLN